MEKLCHTLSPIVYAHNKQFSSANELEVIIVIEVYTISETKLKNLVCLMKDRIFDVIGKTEGRYPVDFHNFSVFEQVVL